MMGLKKKDMLDLKDLIKNVENAAEAVIKAK